MPAEHAPLHGGVCACGPLHSLAASCSCSQHGVRHLADMMGKLLPPVMSGRPTITQHSTATLKHSAARVPTQLMQCIQQYPMHLPWLEATGNGWWCDEPGWINAPKQPMPACSRQANESPRHTTMIDPHSAAMRQTGNAAAPLNLNFPLAQAIADEPHTVIRDCWSHNEAIGQA